MVAAVSRRQAEGVQPFDPFRHLGAVTDLIDQVFADELGPAGRHTLQRMRRMARWGGVALWLAGVDTFGAPGFVWLADGQVVGNVSLRRAASPGGWVVGNVAVAPAYQGQGIGRALMEAAVEAVRGRGGTWVGLEVREDNQVARGLYERMGFELVGTMVEAIRPAGVGWPRHDIRLPGLRVARGAESGDLYRLARMGLDSAHRQVLEVRRSAYRAGWEARITGWLEGVCGNWWVVEREGRVVGGLRVSSRWFAHWHRIEVLVETERMEELGPQLVAAGVDLLSRRPTWETTTVLPGRREALEPAFVEAGFRRARRLVQMRLMLGRRIRVM
jgi:ribosomal protein S18 acetylase RimI-like enzyme